MVLLIIVLIPMLLRMQKTAQSVKCMSRLNELGVVALLYVAEHDNYLPPVRMEPTGFWYDHLHEYIGRRAGRAGRFEAGHKENNPWWCPSVGEANRRYTYAINLICGFSDIPNQGHYVKMGQRFLKSAGSILPLEGCLSKTAWFADGNTEYFRPVIGGTGNFLDWRHNNHANVLFMDGHVESVQNPNFNSNPALFQEDQWIRFFGQTP